MSRMRLRVPEGSEPDYLLWTPPRLLDLGLRRKSRQRPYPVSIMQSQSGRYPPVALSICPGTLLVLAWGILARRLFPENHVYA
jgi:hypothetical protein